MGLGFNVADDFIDMLFNYDRRGFWLSRIKKVLNNWKKKGLKWINNDLKRVLNLDLPISSKELNLKPWGNEACINSILFLCVFFSNFAYSLYFTAHGPFFFSTECGRINKSRFCILFFKIGLHFHGIGFKATKCCIESKKGIF